MFKMLRYWKEISGTSTGFAALRRVIAVGVDSLEHGGSVTEWKDKFETLEQEYLELARLVHDYETKLVNSERRAMEAEEKNKRLEWAHVALARENQWMKEDILKQRRQHKRRSQ